MIWPKPSCASPFNFDRGLTAGRKVVYRILGPTAPQAADRSSQAASESNAALRQHIQNNDIASSDPRLVKKIVVRGSWFVVRKKPAIILGWAVMNSLWRAAHWDSPYKCGIQPHKILSPVCDTVGDAQRAYRRDLCE